MGQKVEGGGGLRKGRKGRKGVGARVCGPSHCAVSRLGASNCLLPPDPGTQAPGHQSQETGACPSLAHWGTRRPSRVPSRRHGAWDAEEGERLDEKMAPPAGARQRELGGVPGGPLWGSAPTAPRVSQPAAGASGPSQAARRRASPARGPRLAEASAAPAAGESARAPPALWERFLP